MTTVSHILNYLQTLAPPSMAESWDHVGLNCGHLGKEVRTLLVALDPFAAVCQEAADLHADLLVTHHALLWNPGFIADADAQGKNTLFLIEHGIAHINAHTNLDYAPGGVNDVLARRLGLQSVEVLDPKGIDGQGQPWGLVRLGTVPPQPLTEFLCGVQQRLGCPGLRYTEAAPTVHRVAVGGGACGSELYAVAKAGCDTFVTSDIKYNQFWDAQELGLNLIDAGHFYTENPVCAMLAQKIQSAFPEIQVHLSGKHRDYMKFFKKS